jgi:hypothetical protein
MSWVTECLKQRKEAVAPPLKELTQGQSSPAWWHVWEAVKQVVEHDVLEYNNARGRQYTIRTESSVLFQVFPSQPPLDSAVFQIDRQTGVIQVDCPIDHPGTPRRGHLKIMGESIVPLSEFVGTPQPTATPMTPEKFSEFILKPLFFPE